METELETIVTDIDDVLTDTDDVHHVLERTNDILDKICNEFHTDFVAFKGKFYNQEARREIKPYEIVRFFQYTVWIYLKYKWGIYPNEDLHARKHFNEIELHEYEDFIQKIHPTS